MKARNTTKSFIFAALLCGAGAAHAEPLPSQARPSYRNSIVADLGLSVIGLAYQRVLHPHVELQLQAHFYSPWYLTSGIAGLGAQLRSYFFVSGTAPAGAYFSPFVRATYVRGSLNQVERAGLGWTVGATFGQSFVFARRGLLRVGVGLQYLSYGVATDAASARIQTFYPTADLSIGVAF